MTAKKLEIAKLKTAKKLKKPVQHVGTQLQEKRYVLSKPIGKHFEEDMEYEKTVKERIAKPGLNELIEEITEERRASK